MPPYFFCDFLEEEMLNRAVFANVPKRTLLLGGAALLLAAILIARWCSDWGLVTIHVKDAPLGKVIESIQRQGHVRVESSLDPALPVSLDVDRVNPVQAIDLLSARTEASWRLVYLCAPSKEDLKAAVVALRGSGSIDGWRTSFFPGAPFITDSGLALDPRRLALAIEGTERELGTLLDQAAQKSGVMTCMPEGWNPVAPALPKPGIVAAVIPSMIRSAHGKAAEFFFLSERSRHRGEGRSEGDRYQQAEQAPVLWETMNPEWREQRQLAQIELLPESDKEAARIRLAERRTLFAAMQGLTPEQRREKWRQMMADPERFLQIQDLILLRQIQRTPKQQIDRAVGYIQRKAAAQGR